MLFVMTICDLKAVSPDSWTDWKGQMLTECYLRTAELLGGQLPAGQRSPLLNRQAIAERVLDAFVRLATPLDAKPAPKARQDYREEVEAFFRNVSEYYLRANEPGVIAQHCLLSRDVGEHNPLVWRLSNDPATPAANTARNP